MDPPAKDHVPALDGLRGLAILAVLWHHASYEAEGGGMIPFAGNPASALHNLAHAAWTGVDLFFVLSGFLITGILLDARGSARYFPSFYARRSLRIFPLYYASILGVGALFCVAYRSEVRDFVPRLPWLLTYTTNLGMAAKNAWWFSNHSISLDHFWSLAVEEQFYLLWPLLVLRCSRRTLKALCVAMILGALTWRTLTSLCCDNHWLVFYQLPSRADSLAMGALTAIQIREARGLGRSPVRGVLVAGALLLVALLDGRMVPYFGLTAFGWFYRSVLVATLTTRLAVPLSFAPLRSVGKYSYGLYVIHMLLLRYVWHGTGLDRLTSFRAPALAAALFACSYAAALVSWHVLEKPFLALKRHFPMRSEARIVAPATGTVPPAIDREPPPMRSPG